MALTDVDLPNNTQGINTFIQPCVGLSIPTKKGARSFKMSVTCSISATRCNQYGNYQNLKLHVLISDVGLSALIPLWKDALG